MMGHLRKQSLVRSSNSCSLGLVMSKSSMTATHGTEYGVVMRKDEASAPVCWMRVEARSTCIAHDVGKGPDPDFVDGIMF